MSFVFKSENNNVNKTKKVQKTLPKCCKVVQVGQIRQHNITKKGMGIKRRNGIYAVFNSIKDTLDYDFSTEKQFSYEGLLVETPVKHLENSHLIFDRFIPSASVIREPLVSCLA